MKYLFLGMAILAMNSLTGCGSAFHGDESRFGVDTNQRYFYDRGPSVLPRTNFDGDYR